MKYLIWSILLFTLQCSINSADIRKGNHLEKAQETSVEEFFERRMKNRTKKVIGANWEIFFESEDFVYYGYPLVSFFREGTFVDEFFKVNRTKLQNDFPAFHEFDGIKLRNLCYDSLAEYSRSTNDSLFQSFNCKAFLEQESIEIFADLTFKKENQYKIEKYKIIFDKKKLKRESILKL
ncbi:MAG TPA: hypothetical protein PK079_24345 [Leptospiraceae bacterium]|nr:hypothetical protein [Leptospiraceae bacterium]HMW03697.1 hypothetical protein [Leptospiraceae bacterium]HMX35385.1 hypothetical protein [Leptospiraceae bacterium]HMY29677.1 hypothetical protein [Leptospiraceae bacterium]HMZ64047.1 hypothetical protein [Leptospiraceae bacterium]